jgi:transcriptional regulator with XRE-family HTH domain
MDMRRLVGQNVKRIRQRRGLTQERFAELSGFSQQYISGLESGHRNPTVVTVYELAVALGVSHIDLMRPTKSTSKGRSGTVAGLSCNSATVLG